MKKERASETMQYWSAAMHLAGLRFGTVLKGLSLPPGVLLLFEILFLVFALLLGGFRTARAASNTPTVPAQREAAQGIESAKEDHFRGAGGLMFPATRAAGPRKDRQRPRLTARISGERLQGTLFWVWVS